MDREHAQPVKQVLAELPPCDAPCQVPIRCSDHAYIGLERASPADPLELPLFEHPQVLGLYGRAHFGDLIAKQRPALSLLDSAGPVKLATDWPLRSGRNLPAARAPIARPVLDWSQFGLQDEHRPLF